MSSDASNPVPKPPAEAGTPGAIVPAPAAAPQEIRVLGMPYGSVRALLSLMVLGMVVLDVLRDQDHLEALTPSSEMVEVLWNECLVIVLAGYFTSRRFVRLPAEVVQRLEAEGVLPIDRPLGLPRYTMRFLLILAFVALGVHLWRESRLLEAKSAQVLGLALAFLLGALSAPIAKYFTGKGGTPARLWWENLKAILALSSVAGCMVASLAFGMHHLPTWATSLTIWMVLFYFGSR